MAEKTERNPKGAGRPATGIKRTSLCISGSPAQFQKLRELAEKEHKTISQFIFDKTGVSGDTYEPLNKFDEKYRKTHDMKDLIDSVTCEIIKITN